MIKTDTGYKIEAVRSLGFLGVIIGGDISVSGFTDTEIQAEVLRLQAEYDSKQYSRDRAADYPSIADQLDTLYHGGIDAWKAEVKVVKDKYPKG